MKIKIIGGLLVAFLSIGCGIKDAQAEIKVGIAGPLSSSSLIIGEQQEIGAQKAVDHLNFFVLTVGCGLWFVFAISSWRRPQ